MDACYCFVYYRPSPSHGSFSPSWTPPLTIIVTSVIHLLVRTLSLTLRLPVHAMYVDLVFIIANTLVSIYSRCRRPRRRSTRLYQYVIARVALYTGRLWQDMATRDASCVESSGRPFQSGYLLNAHES